jgi:hypothetical protein
MDARVIGVRKLLEQNSTEGHATRERNGENGIGDTWK